MEDVTERFGVFVNGRVSANFRIRRDLRVVPFALAGQRLLTSYHHHRRIYSSKPQEQ